MLILNCVQKVVLLVFNSLRYRHDNILPLYGYSEQDNGLCLIYQFMVNGSLEDRLLRKVSGDVNNTL